MSVFTHITDYIRSAKAELTKVTWPSREQTVRYSTLIIGISIVVALFFASLDLGLTKVVDLGLAYRAQIQSAPPAAAKTTTSTPDVTVSSTSVSPTIDLTNIKPVVTTSTK